MKINWVFGLAAQQPFHHTVWCSCFTAETQQPVSHTLNCPPCRGSTGVTSFKGLFYQRKESIMRSSGDLRFFTVWGEDFDLLCTSSSKTTLKQQQVHHTKISAIHRSTHRSNLLSITKQLWFRRLTLIRLRKKHHNGSWNRNSMIWMGLQPLLRIRSCCDS